MVPGEDDVEYRQERYRLPALDVDDMQHPPFEGLVEAEGQCGKDQAQDRQRAPQPHAKSFFLWRFCHSRTASASRGVMSGNSLSLPTCGVIFQERAHLRP